jgi:uncharacterized membrane protein YgcG
MDGLPAAIATRDAAAVREIIAPILGTPGVHIGLPKPLTETQLASSKEVVKVGRELIAACRAKAAAPRAKGCFCVLIVTPSAPRAASICGTLRRGGISVAKLFGKHMAVEEQSESLAANLVDVAVGTPNRLARLAEGHDFDLGALRYILLDVMPDEKKMHFFSQPPKGMTRRPDCEDLVGMLSTAAFKDAFAQSEKRAPVLCPVLLPSKAALEASTPVGQQMSNKARGRGAGGRGKGGGGPQNSGKGRGGGGGRAGIHKKSRPRPSAFTMRPKNGSG